MINEFQYSPNMPIVDIRESSSNPRRTFKGMEELVTSVQQHGVLVPLLLRPVNGHYEIIAGARRYRAAKEAGLQNVPARIREMDDSEALELMICDNLCREDVHPLEEALGYKELLERPGYNVAAVAGKVAKSESYVYQRLKLAELVKSGQDLFLEDKITAGHAILIARLQPADQEKAIESLFTDSWSTRPNLEEARSVRELSRWIHENIHLDLHKAPWKMENGLLTGAGSCLNCPKRTGFIPQLFPDVAKKDTCTDRACYEEKMRAHIDEKKASLEKKGTPLIEVSTEWAGKGKAQENAPLSRDHWQEIRDKKDRCEHTQKAIVVSGYGENKGKLIDICSDKHCDKHRHNYTGDSAYQDQQKKAEEKKRLEGLIRKEIGAQILEIVTFPLDATFLEMVAVSVWSRLWSEHRKQIAKSKHWEVVKQKNWNGVDYDATAAGHVKDMTDTDLQRWLVEMALITIMEPQYGNHDDRLVNLADKLDIDHKAVDRRIRDEAADRKKAKKSKSIRKNAKDSESNAAAKPADDRNERMKGYWENRRKQEKKMAAKKSKVHTSAKNKNLPKSGKADNKAPAPAKAGQNPPEGAFACEYCSCTEDRACVGGCSWSGTYLLQGRYVCSACEEKVADAESSFPEEEPMEN